MRLIIYLSERRDKKYKAVFTDTDGKHKTIHFGAKGMSDYTIHNDDKRRELYLARHRKTEDWTKPMTAGALSRWILWGPTTSLLKNIKLFKERFNLT